MVRLSAVFIGGRIDETGIGNFFRFWQCTVFRLQLSGDSFQGDFGIVACDFRLFL